LGFASVCIGVAPRFSLMADSREPLVFLVGAGPGDPELLTLRAAACLAKADLVLYDKLVPARVLELAPPVATKICVTELASCHVHRSPHVHAVMIEAARQGKRVVRLKGGDPFLFGRGGEEAEVLRQAGIPYEIVPGITAGIAASVCAGIPLTHRLHASAVAFVTGHEDPDKPESALDWSVLARFPGTLVVYMGFVRLPQIVQTLLEHGKLADTPAAVVQLASTGDQRTVEAPLRDLAGAVRTAGLSAPAIVLIGPVVGLRRRLAWFERRPLFGRHVLVTRPRHQAGDLLSRLGELGAVPFLLPGMEIQEPADWRPVDRALERLGDFQWLVFTSANGVHAFLKRLRQTGRDLRALGKVQLAAIGPGTTEALRRHDLEPDLVPPEFRSESLASALKERVAGGRVLLARADRGRELLRLELGAVAHVEQVAVYSQVNSVAADAAVFDRLRRGEIDYMLFTSSNIARAVLGALDRPCRARVESGQAKLVSISPVTSAVIRELGFPVAGEATRYTIAGLVEALVDLASRS
jgi:uroporphyrinogen III methyltransferase/synthase